MGDQEFKASLDYMRDPATKELLPAKCYEGKFMMHIKEERKKKSQTWCDDFKYLILNTTKHFIFTQKNYSVLQSTHYKHL